MTVYVVTGHFWDDFRLVGVYRTQKEAYDAGRRFLAEYFEWGYEVHETEMV